MEGSVVWGVRELGACLCELSGGEEKCLCELSGGEEKCLCEVGSNVLF